MTFKQLLNTVHQVNSVESKPIYLIHLHKVTNEAYDVIFTLNPSPFEDWKELINNLFKSLETQNKQENVLESYNEISTRYRKYMDAIKSYIGERNHNFLEKMLDQPIAQIVDSIRASLLITLQRVLKGFNTDALVIQKSYGFKSNDNEDEDLRGIDYRIVEDIKNMLKSHSDYLKSMSERLVGIGKSKIEYGVQRLSLLLNAFKKSIRGPMLPGGSTGVDYILKAGIAGTLYEIMNQNMSVPDAYLEDDTVLDTSNLPKQIISELIIRYESETFRLTEEEIKLAVAIRNEKEKMLFINKLDKLTPEEKRLELIQKKLGLGEWSRGGTKSIYSYNSEQYEFERNQRAEMGLRSQSQAERYNLLTQEQGMDSGYDNQQINPDDY